MTFVRAVASAALLSSDKDGEALNATRALARLLGKNGLDTAKVIEAGLRVGAGGLMDKPRQKTAPEPMSPLRPHHLSARMTLAYGDNLTNWERNFLSDICELSRLSPKQQERLNLIAAKVERDRR